MIERFIIYEDFTELGKAKASGHLESEMSIAVVRAAEPLLVGARRLLDIGYDPRTLLTTRWRGKSFDNFVPREIGILAEYTVSESNKGGPHIERFKPFPGRT